MIEGSFIGTDASGTADLGNGQSGVSLGGTSPSGVNSRVGGSTIAARNLISGNDRRGIFVGSDGTANWRIEGNLIGTDRTGKESGNGIGGVDSNRGGIYLNGANDTLILGNVIAFNDGWGVGVNDFSPTSGNDVFANQIFGNSSLGIDLGADGPTPNDLGPPPDTDDGPNGLQNAPKVAIARPSKIKVKIATTEPSTTVRFDFYASLATGGPAREVLGAQLAVSDAAGKLTTVFKPSTRLALGRVVTATATTADDGTSEFSKPRVVQ